MEEQKQDDKLESIYKSSVLIQDIAWKTYWEQWTIDRDRKRGCWQGDMIMMLMIFPTFQ